MNALTTDPEEKKMMNKVVIFVIFGANNGPSDVTWTTLMMFLLPFWTWTVYRRWSSMEGQKALGLNLKYLKLCSEDERRSYGFGMT